MVIECAQIAGRFCGTASFTYRLSLSYKLIGFKAFISSTLFLFDLY